MKSPYLAPTWDVRDIWKSRSEKLPSAQIKGLCYSLIRNMYLGKLDRLCLSTHSTHTWEPPSIYGRACWFHPSSCPAPGRPPPPPPPPRAHGTATKRKRARIRDLASCSVTVYGHVAKTDFCNHFISYVHMEMHMLWTLLLNNHYLFF